MTIIKGIFELLTIIVNTIGSVIEVVGYGIEMLLSSINVTGYFTSFLPEFLMTACLVVVSIQVVKFVAGR